MTRSEETAEETRSEETAESAKTAEVDFVVLAFEKGFSALFAVSPVPSDRDHRGSF
jgi:hypothetical protein